MLQWFISFPEFAEFAEILFYLGKTPFQRVSVVINPYLFLTGLLSVYIDGCLFEAVGSTSSPNTHNPRNTLIGKSTSMDRWYAGIKFDEFMFWEKVLEAPYVMSLYISDRWWRKPVVSLGLSVATQSHRSGYFWLFS